MIIADLDHINVASEVQDIEGSLLASSLALVLQGLPFAINDSNVEYLTLGSFASVASINQESLATAVNGSRISSGRISLTQIAFG